MSRRAGGRHGYLGGTATAPPSSISITAVSQTAGKAAGGTAVTVSGTGFVSGMTSALGAVSGITSNSCTVTTGAHAAGSLSWTLTTPGGLSAANQTFTYLGTPTLTSLSPNTGPATVTNTGVTFTGTNFPASGTGCPVTVAVGSGSGTPTLNNSTTCTSSFTAPGTGVKTATITVDSVASSALASAFTGTSAPSISSATGVSTAGGTTTIRGAQFVTGCTVTVGGGIGSVTVTFVSSSQVTAVIPAHAASAGLDVTLTNPDTQTDTLTAGLVITGTSDLGIIFGGNLVGWYRGDSLVTGSPVTAWGDLSGAGNSLGTGVAPSFNATDAHFNGQPSITFNGTTQYLKKLAATFAGSVGQPVFICAAIRFDSAGAPGVAIGVNAAGINDEIQVTTTQVRFAAGSFTATYSPAVVGGSAVQLYGYLQGGTGTLTSAISVAASTETTGSGSIVTGSLVLMDFGIGARPAGSVFAPVTIAEVGIANVVPNGTQIAQVKAYFNLRYNLEAPPLLTSITKVPTAGAGARIKGTGFISGCTVTAGGSIGAALTTTFVSSTVLEVVVPAASAGTYDITIANPDGGTIFVNDALTVTATNDDAMVIFGLPCVGLYRADSLSASPVSLWSDSSNVGNDLIQATGGSQPTWSSSSAHFNSQPIVTGDGTAQFLNIASFKLASTVGQPVWIFAVLRQLATPGTTRASFSYNTQVELQQLSTGIPRAACSNMTAVWGSSQTGTSIMVAVEQSAGTSGGAATCGINVGNTTEITASTGSLSLTAPASGTFSVFARTTGTIFSNIELAELVVVNAAPTTGQKSAYELYALTRYGVL